MNLQTYIEINLKTYIEMNVETNPETNIETNLQTSLVSLVVNFLLIETGERSEKLCFTDS